MAEIRLEKPYAVADDDVTLSVRVGEAHTGTINVKVDGETKVEGDHEVSELNCGAGAELEQIVVRTRVHKSHDHSGRASVTYALKGGKKEESWVSRGEFEDPDKALRFRGVFTATPDDSPVA